MMVAWSNMAQGDCQEKVLTFANDDEVGAKLLE